MELERFKIVREYDIEACVCALPPHVVGTLDETARAWWAAHAKVCPNRVVSRYLVCAAYEESWRKNGTPAQREPWFYDSLDGVASTMDTTRYALLKALCSNVWEDDWKELSWAWQCILDYHGWRNGDGYPITLSLPEVKKRYAEELGK